MSLTATLAQLRHFVALVDKGSFSKAADECHRSQAAFSHSISALESNLGGSLIDRAIPGVTLTPLGHLVLSHARQLVAQANDLARAARQELTGAAGLVRIGLAPMVHALLARPLLEMATSRPGMKLHIAGGTIAQQLVALRERRVDAVINQVQSLPEARTDLTVRRMCEFPIAVIARSGHPLCQLKQVAVGDLGAYPVATTLFSDSFSRQVTDQFGTKAQFEVLFSIVSEDVPMLLNLVETSNALFAGAQAAATERIEQGALVKLEFDTLGLKVSYAWITRRKMLPFPVLDAVFDLATRELAKHHAAD